MAPIPALSPHGQRIRQDDDVGFHPDRTRRTPTFLLARHRQGDINPNTIS